MDFERFYSELEEQKLKRIEEIITLNNILQKILLYFIINKITYSIIRFIHHDLSHLSRIICHKSLQQ